MLLIIIVVYPNKAYYVPIRYLGLQFAILSHFLINAVTHQKVRGNRL